MWAALTTGRLASEVRRVAGAPRKRARILARCCTTHPAAPTSIPHLFDTERQHEVPLADITGGERLVWYSCGPTVYDAAHLGHARAYVTTDILRRALTHLTGMPPLYVLGMTDIDDKIIARAAEAGTTAAKLAQHWEREFMRDMQDLGVQPPSVLARVTQHIPHIVQFIEQLQAAGFTYTTGDGVWFRVSALGEQYGRLHRSAVPPGPALGQPDGRDFALWKAAKPGEPSWPSPWGAGRPGWHIECSAMALAATGCDTLHLHSGGVDLRFPHHTNEAAQSEARLAALSGRGQGLGESSGGATAAGCCGDHSHAVLEALPRWVQAWLHIGHVHIAGQKMSKSLKNFVSIREFLDSGGQPDEFRLWCALHHYRAPVTYSAEALTEPRAVLRQMRRALRQAEEAELAAAARTGDTGSSELPWRQAERELRDVHSIAVGASHSALCADLHTPSLVREAQRVCNALMQYHAHTGGHGNPLLLRDVRTWVHSVCGDVLGVRSLCRSDFEQVAQTAKSSSALEADPVDLVKARIHVDALRQAMRTVAAHGGTASATQLYALSDQLRTVLQPLLGQVLPHDAPAAQQASAAADWAAVLGGGSMSSNEAAGAAAGDAVQGYAAPVSKPNKQVPLWQTGAHWATCSREPARLFLDDPQFGTFDAAGIPLTYAGGEALSKSMRKKMAKAADKYTARFLEKSHA